MRNLLIIIILLMIIACNPQVSNESSVVNSADTAQPQDTSEAMNTAIVRIEISAYIGSNRHIAFALEKWNELMPADFKERLMTPRIIIGVIPEIDGNADFQVKLKPEYGLKGTYAFHYPHLEVYSKNPKGGFRKRQFDSKDDDDGFAMAGPEQAIEWAIEKTLSEIEQLLLDAPGN